MLHELLVALSGYPGDIFRPFPPEPAIATTFAIQDFPLLHPAEKATLDRLAQLGFYFREFGDFILSCRALNLSHSSIAPSSSRYSGRSQERRSATQRDKAQNGQAKIPGQSLYLMALANALERKLQSYRQVIIKTETAILSGEDNHGGMVPLSMIAARFAPYELVFPAISSLLCEIQKTPAEGEAPYKGGQLIDLLRDRASSGVPLQREWMSELLKGCCAVMMRQIVAWVLYGQIQDPYQEFFVVSRASGSIPTASAPSQVRDLNTSRDFNRRKRQASESALMQSSTWYPSMTNPMLTGDPLTTTGTTKWQDEYGVAEDRIPLMVPLDLAYTVLFIGKSVATVREAKPKPFPIPSSTTRRHLELILPLVPLTTTEDDGQKDTDVFYPNSEVLDMYRLAIVLHEIRGDVANHLWNVVQIGKSVITALESFRRYFLLCDGEFGLKLIGILEEFQRHRLSRVQVPGMARGGREGIRGDFSTSFAASRAAAAAGVNIRDHDLGGLLIRASQGTLAQDDPSLRHFEFRLSRPGPPKSSRDMSTQSMEPGSGASASQGQRDQNTGQGEDVGIFDDQLLGIPVRLVYTLSWPLDFFLTAEDLKHYGDIFAFLMTVRKTQSKLQQAWMDARSMMQQARSRQQRRNQTRTPYAAASKKNRVLTGTEPREYSKTVKEVEDERDTLIEEQEAEILKHVATIRADMGFVVDCLWAYLQMDVVEPTYNTLLQTIAGKKPSHERQYDSQHQESSFMAGAPSSSLSSSMDVDMEPSAASQSFDEIYAAHVKALHEVRQACFLNSDSLSMTLKNIFVGVERYCGIVGRRAAGQDGFQAGLEEKQDENMWQDWMDITQLNKIFRENTDKLYSELTEISRSGIMTDGPVLKRSSSGLGSSVLGNRTGSFEVLRQVDQLLLRLEYSKSRWFRSSRPSPDEA
ncbi:Gamma-tubulin complex component 4 [Lunasporangiospora selenospora]|uniref:Spindle pole body component n=1 Tax=Lunasporangiospora selenospora TaxID=979761 RepID=A0A9P6G1K9_9FUNG|nr:Gamma-tubulin complex component 4 [Lunasporangiospora selenospora]